LGWYRFCIESDWAFSAADRNVRDPVVVTPCDHVVKLVEAFSGIVQSGKVDPQWPTRTLACHKVMAALFKSAETGGGVV